jgi:excisionase family DNA binding protein
MPTDLVRGISTKEVAKRTGYSEMYLHKLAREGRLPDYLVGHWKGYVWAPEISRSLISRITNKEDRE